MSAQRNEIQPPRAVPHSPRRKLDRCLFYLLAAVCLLPRPASALVMRPDGPEPIIIQIKESLRLSDNLDNRLSQLAAAQTQSGLSVVRWHAGEKLLVMLSFPANFTEQQALAVVAALKQLPAVQKVVAASAVNLEFNPEDFTRQYASNQAIPEAARRGLDREEASQAPPTQAQIDQAAQIPHVARQLIVRWKSRYVWRATAGGFLQNIADFHAAAGAHVLQEWRQSETELSQVIEFDNPATSLAGKLRQYSNCPWVLYAQPNFTYSNFVVSPNDPYYATPGQPNLPKIKAPEAWSISKGSRDVVIAVADSGANINHPDFAAPTPTPGATPTPGNLSPGQRNFVTDRPPDDVTDTDIGESWHGTRVASIIGSIGNNQQFMTGVAWNTSLLILRVTANGSHDSAKDAAAINYAGGSDGHQPATAINCSFGSEPKFFDKALTAAVAGARKNNMVVVAAAGNNGRDLDADNDHLISPACLPYDNVITVGATRVRPDNTNLDDTKPLFSNYGQYRVELGAPGGEDGLPDEETFGILGLTPLPNGPPTYTKHSGTSFSAPQVCGALALVKSAYPWEDYLGIRDRVIMGTDRLDALVDQGKPLFRTQGRLNLFKALQKRTLIRNFSARAKVESGDRILIGGFTIGYTDAPNAPNVPNPALKVAIRGLGPSLGVSAPLPNPQLILYDSSGNKIADNDDWHNLPQGQLDDLHTAGLIPERDSEAAMVRVLPPGSYTCALVSQDTNQGVALFELWELSGNTSERTRLKAVSARCLVGLGEEVAIAGTIVGDPNGSADVPRRRLLMRGRGPSLAALGVPGVLADPQIELHDSTGLMMDSNDQWRQVDGASTGLEEKLNAAGFAPQCGGGVPSPCESESVLWPTLVRGAYSTILQGTNHGVGIGLIEFFEY